MRTATREEGHRGFDSAPMSTAESAPSVAMVMLGMNQRDHSPSDYWTWVRDAPRPRRDRRHPGHDRGSTEPPSGSSSRRFGGVAGGWTDLPSPARDGQWVEPDGTIWRLPGHRRQPTRAKRVERLMHSPQVLVLHFHGVQPTEVGADDREAVGADAAVPAEHRAS